MAQKSDDGVNVDLEQVLKQTGLVDLYPEKLTRQSLFSIKIELPNKTCLNSFDQHLKYVSNIIHYSPQSRNLRCQHELSKNTFRAKGSTRLSVGSHQQSLHPLDITTAVFLCCDHIARQDLVEHIWGCKHAFPIVLKPQKHAKVKLYTWPMKSLIVSIPSRSNTAVSVDKRLYNVKMKIVSFIRMNSTEISRSKSEIINHVISQTEKVHSTFFHRDCEGSTRSRSNVCQGMIEASMNVHPELGNVLYLNLRGNAQDHTVQRDILYGVSNIVFILCGSEANKVVKTSLQSLKIDRNRNKVVILSVDRTDDECMEICDELSKCLSINVDIVNISQFMKPELVTELSGFIKEISEAYAMDIDGFVEHVREMFKDDVEIDSDELNSNVQKANEVSMQIEQFYSESTLESLFPLQGKEYLEWATADKEFYRLKNRKMGQNIKTYREDLEQTKMKCRDKQRECIRSTQFEVPKTLIHILTENCRNGDETFIRSLKLDIDDITGSLLNKLYVQYRDVFIKLSTDQRMERQLKDQLRVLDKLFNASCATIACFVREMGQLYEALQHANDPNCKVLQDLPAAAARLLTFGYPIEILDGRSNSVPVVWIQCVLKQLAFALGNRNARIKVVSILGIQSTGKSTLLNIMFGTHFPTGSGRCTRGAYLQLVKVEKAAADTYALDYLLIIDTAGLFSMDSEFGQEQEREFATFVIGLANTTLINIMGENMNYLKEILPISVHAFLRMDLIGLSPKCRLVHQNVDSRSKQHLLVSHRNLETTLNECTAAACKLEKVNQMVFNEIIKFNISNDIDYFPPLLYQAEHIETVSDGYSREAAKLKRVLVEDKQAGTTMVEFVEHIQRLLKAIKSDNFVFEFKNIVATEARIILDKQLCHVHWKLKQNAQESVTKLQIRLKNCLSSKEVELCLSSCRDDITHAISKEYDSLLAYLETSFTEHSTVISNAMKSSKMAILQAFSTIRGDIIDHSLKVLNNEAEKRRQEIDILLLDDVSKIKVEEFISKSSKDTFPHPDQLWERWIASQLPEATYSTEPRKLEDCAMCAVYDVFEIYRNVVENELTRCSLPERSFKTFVVSEKHFPEVCELLRDNDNARLKMANEVLEDIKKYEHVILEKIRKTQHRYTTELFRDMILKVRNHECIYENKLMIKPIFEIDLSLSVLGDIIHCLKNESIQTKLFTEELLSGTKRYFLSTCRCISGRIEKFKSVTRSITEIIKQGIINTARNELPYTIVRTLKENQRFLQSKHTVIIYVLTELLKTEDFTLIYRYIVNPVGSIRSWLCRVYDEYTGLESTQSAEVDSAICQFVEIIVKNIEKCMIIDEDLTQKIENYKRDNTSAELMTFCTKTIISRLETTISVSDIIQYENEIVDTNEPLDILQSINLNIKELLRPENLDTLVRNIHFVMFEKHYDDIRATTVDLLIAGVLGCTERCPFCKELCILSQKNHEGDHMTMMHKPRGCVGECFDNSNCLISSTCSQDVALDERLKACPRWNIHQDRGLDTGSYWKFIFVNYKEQLTSRMEKDAPSDIPQTWLSLTKEGEILKLQRYMDSETFLDK